MNSLSLTPPSSSTLPNLKQPRFTLHHYSHINQERRILIRNRRCKAVLLHDAPFAGAITACILNSLIFPPPVGPNDNEDGDSMIDSADARFAVMGIISFIPYFNWMSWVFAWMDTEDKRYAAYAIVYLAPYFRSNLSLITDESWLPVASILVGILHIQLEASIKNGDIQNLSLFKRKKAQQETREDEQNLHSASNEITNKIRNWGMPKKHVIQVHHLDEDEGKEEKH
ncbi:hypothetical protein QVD17_04354 [Tagetes erecta]|uniref:Uncharacterized protein n=1 Tax=Tagetes erecta TaxID=13708 RepID=A0AAD8L9Z2_TARER|nr:hypothetical protein QVD17_04354 [Tagetes erecta]